MTIIMFKLKIVQAFFIVILLICLTNCATPQRFFVASPTATLMPTATATLTPLPPSATPSLTLAAFNDAPTNTPTNTATPRLYQNDTLPTRSPTTTPLPGIACVVGSDKLNLREGPGQTYQTIRTLPAQAKLQAQKRISGNMWLLVTTPGHNVGWVQAQYIACQGNLADLPLAQGVSSPGDAVVPSLTPVPLSKPNLTPTSTNSPTPPVATMIPPIPVGRWQGQYYDNPSLLGEPVFIRADEDIDFNWILDSPDSRIPSDNFSIRWTGVFDFVESGDYRFFAKVDDGIKIYVDGWQVIDAWHTGIGVDYEGDFADLQAGLHTLVVEYFESGGHAQIKVWAKRDTFADARWQGDYYNNLTWHEPAAFSQSSKNIDFDWGGSAPDNRLTNNSFSIRWQRTLFFDPGNYRFFAALEDEDKVTLRLDGWTSFDTFAENEETIEGSFGNLGAGYHTLTVEYQDHGGKAKIKFWWERE